MDAQAFTRIDTHRAQVMHLDADDSSAQEGLIRAANAAADAPDLFGSCGPFTKPSAPLKPKSSRINWPMWSGVIAVGLVCACALVVHFLAAAPK